MFKTHTCISLHCDGYQEVRVPVLPGQLEIGREVATDA